MNPFNWIKKQSIFKDSQAVWLMIFGILMTGWNLIFTLLNIERRAFKVPVRYSGYLGNISDQAEWTTLYAFSFFAVMTFVFNVVLGIKVHKMRPGLSRALLALNILVALMTFLVARSLLNLL